VHPDASISGSVGVAVRFADGRREIVGWIREFDPDFATTYWLRNPLVIPTGSTLVTEPAQGCAVTLILAGRR